MDRMDRMERRRIRKKDKDGGMERKEKGIGEGDKEGRVDGWIGQRIRRKDKIRRRKNTLN